MNKRFIKVLKKIIFLFIFSSTSLFAEHITFSADSMSGSAKKNATTTVLQGNAQITTEEMEIFADKIELSGEDYKNIRAEGKVKGKNTKSGMEFTCAEMEYDRTSKLAVLTGDVDLKDTENDVTAKAQVISYNSETDIAIMQIGINLVQKDNVCSASYAVYYKKTQMLNLSGNAKIKQKEDTFRAQQITLNMETEEITLDGRVKGTVSEKESGNEAENGNETEKQDDLQDDSIESLQDGSIKAESENENQKSETELTEKSNEKTEGESSKNE